MGIESAYRSRGHAVSADKPVLTGELSYDDKSGVYASAGGVFLIGGGDPGVLALRGDLGFAKRVTPRLTIDVGVTHTQYVARRNATRDTGYTEIYAGMTRGIVSARLYYSPNYFASGIGTLYGEIELAIEPAKNWSIFGHAGRLAYVQLPANSGRRSQNDWSLGAARRLGRIDVHAAVSGGGPGRDFYLAAYHDRTAATAGISYNF